MFQTTRLTQRHAGKSFQFIKPFDVPYLLKRRLKNIKLLNSFWRYVYKGTIKVNEAMLQLTGLALSFLNDTNRTTAKMAE